MKNQYNTTEHKTKKTSHSRKCMYAVMTKLAVDDFPASEKIEIPPVLLTQVMGCLPFSASTSPCAVLCYVVLSTVYYTVLMLRHEWLFPLLLIQCCASWVTNFTSPYLAWHSIYLSKWKLIYPFLFRLVVLSDFRGLCDPCFWQNFDVESNIVKEKIGISIFIQSTVQHSSSVIWMQNPNIIGQKRETNCLPWHEETDDCNCAFVL